MKYAAVDKGVSTHMPLARHDGKLNVNNKALMEVSTHMPLARHDVAKLNLLHGLAVSTHMPLARHDAASGVRKS